MTIFVTSDSEDDAVMMEHKREAMHASDDGKQICERCGKYRKLDLRFMLCKRCGNAVFGREHPI